MKMLMATFVLICVKRQILKYKLKYKIRQIIMFWYKGSKDSFNCVIAPTFLWLIVVV